MKFEVEKINLKIPYCRTVFIFSCKTSGFCGAGCFFGVTFLALFCHFFCLIRGERAKRASANSRHESRAREAGRHHPRPRCRLPSPLWNRGAKRRGWSSVARYEVRLPQVNCESESEKKVKVSNFWLFKISGTFLCYKESLNLNCYV